MIVRALGGVALLFVFVRPCAVPAQAGTVRVQGRIVGVFDAQTLQPIEDAEIVDLYAGASARTPANGLIELSAFPSCHDSAAFLVRKLGFVDTSLVVMVGARDTVPLSLFLRHAPTTLPAVVTEALSTTGPSRFGFAKEFLDLATDGSTHPKVFPPELMRKNEGRWLKDVLFEKGVGSLRCSAGGIRVYYEAAIYYPINSAPLRYNMTSRRACGVLLLWSRQNSGIP